MRSSSRIDRTIQKGKRERLLCGRCDSERIGKYEKHFKEFWFDGPALPPVIAGEIVAVSRVDYACFKLFHLSVLWRASVARQAAFSNVSLGPYHQEKLRTMILGEDPGPEDAYPVWGTVIVGDDRSVVYGLVSAPRRSRLGTFTAYYMCYAGCEWNFLVADRGTSGYEAIFLKRNAPLQLAVRPLRDTKTVGVLTHQRAREPFAGFRTPLE
jgi:hypothetical protein